MRILLKRKWVALGNEIQIPKFFNEIQIPKFFAASAERLHMMLSEKPARIGEST